MQRKTPSSRKTSVFGSLFGKPKTTPNQRKKRMQSRTDEIFSDRRKRAERRKTSNPAAIPASGDRRRSLDRRGSTSNFNSSSPWYLTGGIEVEDMSGGGPGKKSGS